MENLDAGTIMSDCSKKYDEMHNKHGSYAMATSILNEYVKFKYPDLIHRVCEECGDIRPSVENAYGDIMCVVCWSIMYSYMEDEE